MHFTIILTLCIAQLFFLGWGESVDSGENFDGDGDSESNSGDIGGDKGEKKDEPEENEKEPGESENEPGENEDQWICCRWCPKGNAKRIGWPRDEPSTGRRWPFEWQKKPEELPEWQGGPPVWPIGLPRGQGGPQGWPVGLPGFQAGPQGWPVGLPGFQAGPQGWPVGLPGSQGGPQGWPVGLPESQGGPQEWRQGPSRWRQGPWGGQEEPSIWQEDQKGRDKPPFLKLYSCRNFTSIVQNAMKNMPKDPNDDRNSWMQQWELYNEDFKETVKQNNLVADEACQNEIVKIYGFLPNTRMAFSM